MAIALSIIIMFSGNQTAFSMETGSTNEPAAVQEQEDRDDGIVTETASDAEEGNAEAEEMQASEEADQGDSDADQPPGSEEEAGSEIEDASGESGVSSYADSSEEAAAADLPLRMVRRRQFPMRMPLRIVRRKQLSKRSRKTLTWV